MKTAKEMAKDLVQVQGNVFIRELLRELRLPPKRNQAELLATLNEAIDDGKITRESLLEWLARVEGWGRQSVYLWRVPKNLAREPWWQPDAMRARVEGAGITKWEADTSDVFTETFELTAVRLRESVLTFEWHKAWNNLIREEDYDQIRHDLDPDDVIELHAYRQSSRRAAVRVQVRPALGIAAQFVQIPSSSKEHDPVRGSALATAQSVVPADKFKTFDMSTVIRKLDELQLASDDELWTKSARLALDGGYVELASTTSGQGIRDFKDLRETREVLLGRNLSGHRAAFYFQAPGGIDTERPVRVDFYGPERRFWLRAGMTEEQVWKFIERIAVEAA